VVVAGLTFETSTVEEVSELKVAVAWVEEMFCRLTEIM
jgi:hypothetical protein